MDNRVGVEPAVELGTILVIEDDPRMQKVLRRIFVNEDYAIEVAGDGQTGLDLFRAHRPTAVVLDLILPQISGRELCQTMKALSDSTPVIILSAITEVVDKVLLLELGADDYVTKSFSPRELMARVQAAIRRRRRPHAAPRRRQHRYSTGKRRTAGGSNTTPRRSPRSMSCRSSTAPRCGCDTRLAEARPPDWPSRWSSEPRRAWRRTID
jgi:DNA-binding response OmpR family regulator